MYNKHTVVEAIDIILSRPELITPDEARKIINSLNEVLKLDEAVIKPNIVMLGDSYKYSHWKQYPKNMTYMYDYLEARKAPKEFRKVVFVGLQYLLKRYLSKRITQEMVDEAAAIAEKHGISFPKEGWDYIVNNLNGKLPLRINAIPEGTCLPKIGLPMITIESTDSKVPWVVGWAETLLMKVWYPICVASLSLVYRKVVSGYSKNKDWIDFSVHNFGDRSMTSVESADVCGFAHACVFKGTDNFDSLKFAKDYYQANQPLSFSVFATEHSTTTANAQLTSEYDFVLRMLKENPEEPIMSFVADSYDIYKFTDMVTDSNKEIRKLLESRDNQVLVIRPDSGDSIDVIFKMIDIMNKNGVFDATIDSKKFSSKYRILWGDGIDSEAINEILLHFTDFNYRDFIISTNNSSRFKNIPVIAAEMFVFGVGTALGQTYINRDTLGMAIKCSYIETEDAKIDVYKEPITDRKKTSKRGRVITVIDKETKEYRVTTLDEFDPTKEYNALQTVFENGEILIDYSQESIRERIETTMS